MQLKEIEIFAYRSVVNQKISLNENCIALIGPNESGKTNILNAIRSLDEAFPFTIKDKSKINNELPRVEFTFCLSAKEKEALDKESKHFFDDVSVFSDNNIIKSINFQNYSITRYLSKEQDGYKTLTSTSMSYDINITDTLYKRKEESEIPAGTFINYGEEEHDLSSIDFIDKKLLPQDYIQYFELINNEQIEKEINDKVDLIIKDFIPQVIFWEYSDKYLLPAEITYDQFITDNDPYSNSTPLYNIFILSNGLNISNPEDLTNKIAEWKSDSSARKRDSTKLNEDINKYIKSIWQEYDQELNIELEETKITIHVNDPKSPIKNFYEIESRSQGFKTFISFIFNIAAEADNTLLENFILILDEPETHLHPSGVRFMKNELLKLSDDNYVFFATHSIFMIDRENLKRHIILRKVNEISKLIPVERNNIIQESVIYEALGTTIDEFSIGNRNIIVEGDLDFILFEYFVDNCLKRGNVLLDYELLNGGGTKDIYNFFNAKVIPKDSRWILILDCDSPGRKIKDDISKKIPQIKNNLDYLYYSTTQDHELEDLLPDEILISAVNSVAERIELKITSGFSLKDGKCFTKSVEEFKGRNNVEKDIYAIFEELLKDKLLELIKLTLSKVSKKRTIGNRQETFKELLPKYFTFINTVIKQHFNLRF